MKCRLHKTSKNRKRALRKSLLLSNSCAGLPCWQSPFNFFQISLGKSQTLFSRSVTKGRQPAEQARFFVVVFFFLRLSGEVSKKRASLILRFHFALALAHLYKNAAEKTSACFASCFATNTEISCSPYNVHTLLKFLLLVCTITFNTDSFTRTLCALKHFLTGKIKKGLQFVNGQLLLYQKAATLNKRPGKIQVIR